MHKDAHSLFGLVKKDGVVVMRRLSTEQHIRQCLRAIILTHVGERKQEPLLGTTLQDCIYRPMTGLLRREIAAAITHAVQTGESRVELGAVEVEQSAENGFGVTVSLSYRTASGTSAKMKLSL